MNQPEPPTNAMATVDTALVRPAMALPTPEEIRVIEYLGKTYKESGLLPKGVANWQAAVISIQAGRELGIPPTVAIREIYVVNGRPTCSSQLMMSLIRRTYGGQAIRVKEATNESCTVEYREPGWDGVSSLTFSMADAQRAGLAGKDTWRQYPRSMLRNRAVSEVARLAFPDCINGMYTPDEMGAPVDEEGRIVVTGTVIDIETGEVMDAPDADPMAALHAEGAKHGIQHPAFSAWAKATLNVASLADVDGSLLSRLAKRIRVEEGFADQFRAKYQPEGSPDPNPEPEIIDAEIREIDPSPKATATSLEIDGLDELNAAADKVQAAARARS